MLAVTGIFWLIIFGYLPVMFSWVSAADERSYHSVPTIGDDHGYTSLAINLIHGFGFTDSMVLPLDRYHFDLTTAWGKRQRDRYAEKGPETTPIYSFYRAPGFPFLLSGAYAIFGTESIVARRLLATLLWLTMVLLVLTGVYLAGWLGALAGGMAALHHLYYNYHAATEGFQRILTEIPTAFWITLFCFLFVVYQKKKHTALLVLAAVSFAWIVFTRSNFFAALPFILLFCWRQRCSRQVLLLFSAIVIIPIVMWAGYASYTSGRLIPFTSQAEIVFPQFNNIDVLEGVGPLRAQQGGWNPGFVVDEKGNLSLPTPYRNDAKPGESGWVKGLIFWRDHLTQLPRLFYLKLWRNFWYNAGGSQYPWYQDGLYLMGIGFLLLTVGLRLPRTTRSDTSIQSKYAVRFQLILISLLFFWIILPLWMVLAIWGLVLTVALARPYGDYYRLPFPSPVWFLSFIAGYAIITLLFGDPRFHQPLDPPLLFFSILGILLTIYELAARSSLLATLFISVTIGSALLRFGII